METPTATCACEADGMAKAAKASRNRTSNLVERAIDKSSQFLTLGLFVRTLDPGRKCILTGLVALNPSWQKKLRWPGARDGNSALVIGWLDGQVLPSERASFTSGKRAGKNRGRAAMPQRRHGRASRLVNGKFCSFWPKERVTRNHASRNQREHR